MTETVRYSPILLEDLALGIGARQVELADRRIVTLSEINLDTISSFQASLSTDAFPYKVQHNQYYGLTGYKTFEEAISAIGSLDRTLYVPRVTTLTGSLTVPENVRLIMMGAGQFAPASGVTLTIFSPSNIAAEPAQHIFDTTTGTIAFTKSGVVSVKWFGAVGNGATNDASAFQKAQDSLPSTGGDVLVTDAAGYLLNTQIDVDVPTIWRLGRTTLTGPAIGYLFNFTSNDSGIEGTSGTTLTATNGCTGVIHNNQTLRCHYWNFKINPNNAQNAHIFHHDGGWYLDARNIEIDKSTTHSTTNSIYIKSTLTGVAGSTGSYGGAYVSTYDNVVALRLKILGDGSNRVTTMTFKNLDASYVIATTALALTFVQPIIQQTATGTMFTLNDVSGLTAVGGDFEGVSSTIYSFTNSCRGITSTGNQISGSGMVYFSGLPTSSSCFMDDPTVSVSGIINGYVGNLQPLDFINNGWTVRHHLGTQYSGDTFELSTNLERTSATAATLDDVSTAGTVLSLNTSGRFRVQYATAGANPRTLTDLLHATDGGLQLLGTVTIKVGAGTPNTVLVGNVGDIFLSTSGGASTTLWVKESGAGTNTGWVGK